MYFALFMKVLSNNNIVKTMSTSESGKKQQSDSGGKTQDRQSSEDEISCLCSKRNIANFLLEARQPNSDFLQMENYGQHKELAVKQSSPLRWDGEI